MKLLPIVVFLLTLPVVYQNCSENGVEAARLSQKKKVIEDSKVFSGDIEPGSGDKTSVSQWESFEADGFLTAAADYPEYLVAETGPGSVEINEFDPNNHLTIDFSRLCATRASKRRHNIMVTTSIELKIIDIDTNQVICSSTDLEKLRNELIDTGTMTLASCNVPYQSRRYRIEMRNDEGRTLISHSPEFDQNITRETMDLEFNPAGPQVLLSEGTVYTLLDYNRKAGGGQQKVDDSKCDERNSPLVIDFRNDTSKLFTLTDPQSGVSFDLLGDAAVPSPHTPIDISWLTDGDVAYLTLPDDNGRVRGIDELFGDNTLGPDNRRSKHGFHALQKFDGLKLNVSGLVYGDRDMLIDKKDDVFSYLRLWFDRNLDGRAQQSELRSLEDLGVEYIDLKYDPRYRERDQFGNEIVFKSVAGMTDGSMRLVFDIWFYTGGLR